MPQRDPKFREPSYTLDFKTRPGVGDVIAFEPLQLQEMYSHLCMRYEAQLELLKEAAPNSLERWRSEGACSTLETTLTYLLAQYRLYGEAMPDARPRDKTVVIEAQANIRDREESEESPLDEELASLPNFQEPGGRAPQTATWSDNTGPTNGQAEPAKKRRGRPPGSRNKIPTDAVSPEELFPAGVGAAEDDELAGLADL